MSPFYPHDGIPIPYSDGMTAMSVEDICQGLKVFENEDVNLESFTNATMTHRAQTWLSKRSSQRGLWNGGVRLSFGANPNLSALLQMGIRQCAGGTLHCRKD